MKASDLFIKCLEEEGVKYIFGVPGEENLDLLESMRESSIKLIVTRHEQHAAFMAATYGRLTGKTGVCLSTLGPGATNLLTGLAYAQLCGIPLLAITGQKGVKENWQGNFQIVDIVRAFKPVTKWNTSITNAHTIPKFIRHACKTAEAERPGAVHIELPEDVAAEEVTGEPARRVKERRPVPNHTAIDTAVKLLEAAKNPMIIYSAGANRNKIHAELRNFVEQTGIYAVATQMGKGVLSDEHPQSMFSMGIHKKDLVHNVLDTADLIITIGYNIVEYPPSVWSKHKKILHIDFTPAEPDEYYNPDAEVTGDISTGLRLIREQLKTTYENNHLQEERTTLHKKLHSKPPECWPPGPKQVVYKVRKALGNEDIVCLDNGIYKVWFARLYPTYAENTLLLDNALATMGAGLASAMAAKMVYPDRKVVAVVGDGGFMMNSQDLETAVRMQLDIVVVILKDDEYGFIKWKQEQMGFAEFGMQFGNPDFVKYAESYGATGLRVEKDQCLGEVITTALDKKGPVVIECPIDYTDNKELTGDLSKG
ncbi:MAG: acetolactate synthase large subunit [Candidatus Woesearchaeota archaeon]|nr:acetolactate synthase large subunit [Candidatus Woesearchaeota archaeon]